MLNELSNVSRLTTIDHRLTSGQETQEEILSGLSMVSHSTVV